MSHLDLLALCGILVAGFACQWIAWKVRLPSILFLLLVGIAAGPILGWLTPAELLGDLLTPVISIAVAIILFEGSLTLKLTELRGQGRVVRNMVTAGTLVTWSVASLAAHQFLGWDIALSILFGAIVTVSGPTVVIPLLRTVRLKAPIASTLRWEGILIDPLGAILALLVFNLIIANQSATGFTDVGIAMTMMIVGGTVFGALGGYLFGEVLRRRWLPDFLRDYGALAFMLLIFALAEAVAPESGLLAVTIMGISLANQAETELDDILNFKESITLVLVSGLFLLLAARLSLENILGLGLGAVAVFLVLQFIAAPLRSVLCTIGSTLSWPDRVMLGWVFPRGIVAAAVSALFALRLEQAGHPNAENLVPLVFSVILGTVILQSVTAKPLARWLNVLDPDPTGVLIVGSNRVALALGEALDSEGHRVLIVDDDRSGIRDAHKMGLPVFFGSPVSGYAEDHMDLVGIGYLLACSRHSAANELTCVRLAPEFGRDNVYALANRAEAGGEKHEVAGTIVGRLLFDGAETVQSIDEKLHRGSEIKTTKLTDEFLFEAFKLTQVDAVILFTTDSDGHIRFITADYDGLENQDSLSSVTVLTPAI